MSGILQRTAITTTPSSCEAALAGKTKLTNSDITEVFTSSVNTLCLLNVTLDDSAVVELASRVSSSSTLVEFALVNCTGITSDSWATLFGALVENGSLTRVEIEGCNIGEAEAKALATDVIPWNRNIIVWNIGNNPNIGDDGATAFAGALMQAQSGLTKLAFNNIGLATANAANSVMNDLSALTALIQIDISHNPGVFDPSSRNALVTLDDTLKKNAKMHNANASEHTSIVDAIQKDIDTLTATAPAPPKSAKTKKPPVKTPTSGTGTPRRNSPARRPSDAKAETPQKVQRGNTQRTSTGAAQQSPTPRRQSPMRRAASAGTAPKASSSPTRRSLTPLQREVDDGYEEWKRIKDEYNKYIKDCSRPTKAAPIVVKEPKYVLGKPLEKLKHSPSRMFRPTQAIREPNPEERRKLAPWMTDPNEAKKTCPGRKYLFTDEKADPKLGVKIAIIDGGYISAIEDDPRDMGYYARKVQNGEVPKGRTGAFASSTPRECRWGTSTRDQVVKRAQAPGPGYYCVKSEWEIRAEKDKVIAMKNAEGGRGFNSSSRRNVFAVKKVDPSDTHVYHVPGPGAYEIP